MRKSSPKVVWIPSNDANSLSDPGTSSIKHFVLDVSGAAGAFTVGEIPLVIDGADNQLSLTESISDLYNSTYRLRRIVGKIFVSTVAKEAALVGPEVIAVTAGIIVRRTDSISGQSLAGSTANGSLFHPSEIENENDPWIWRRTWLLRAQGAVATFPLPFPTLGAQNYGAQGASAVDGPHIDQKTARIVGPEERLFLDVGATVIRVGNGSAQETTNVDVVCETRVLGSIRTGSGNRRNSSR